MTPRRILCAWCSQFFDWTPPDPRNPCPPQYCKKNHKNAAHKASHRFLSHFTPGRCATPKKKAFDTEEAAVRWLRAYPERFGGDRAYRCSCGLFHLGRVRRDVRAKAS